MNVMDQYFHQRKIDTLRWVIPGMMVIAFMFYQLALARWVLNEFGLSARLLLEVLLYGVVGPLLAFVALTLISRWQSEKELKVKMALEHNDRLAAIIQASADAILGVNKAGKIFSWNRGAENLFGYSANEVIGKPLALLFGNSDSGIMEAKLLLEQASRKDFVGGHETISKDIDNRSFAVDLTITRIRLDDQSELGYSIILRDITSRKQSEAQIRLLNDRLNRQAKERTVQLAEKIKELAAANHDLLTLDQVRSEFVSLASHQIRAPLTNLRGAVERMQNDCQVINPTCARMFVVMEQQAVRLERLVKDVLNAAKIEAGELTVELEPTSITPVVNQTIKQISARLTNRSIRLAEKPGIPMVYVDRDCITEVLINLLDNADKYSSDDKAIDLSIAADQSAVTISVRDHGKGLPEKDLDRIFEKYYRVDNTDSQTAYGYGLGLYVCQRLIEAQNGRIWAENHPEGGAIFSFSVPTWQGDNA